MRLHLTLRPAGAEENRADPAALDCVVEAEPGTPLSAVSDELGMLAGRPGADLFLGSRRLTPRMPLGVAGLRSGAIIGVGRIGERTGVTAAVQEIHVVGGPDAGSILPLRGGTVIVGRDDTCALTLRDPDVSRRHLAVTVGATGVRVGDLGSTNGSFLDGRRLTAGPIVAGGGQPNGAGGGAGCGPDAPVGYDVPLHPGELLRIGETSLCLVIPHAPPAATRDRGDGTVCVNRPPRLAARRDVEVVTVPAEPEKRGPSRLPLLSALLPLVLGVGMAVGLHQPQFLLFALLSPLLLIGGAISERIGLVRGRRSESMRYRQARAEADIRIDREVREEQIRRRAEAPDLARIRRRALGPGRDLWERRRGDPDGLCLRVGSGTRPARLRIVTAAGGPVDAPPPQQPDAADVPVTIAVDAVGVFGVAGPRPPVEALARALLLQLAVLCSPADLSLVILGEDCTAGCWRWARLLPHLRTSGDAVVGLTVETRGRRTAELLRLLESRRKQSGHGDGRWNGSCIVVMLDGASALRSQPGLSRLLAEGPAYGIHAICLDRAVHLLPAECGAVLEVVGEVGSQGRLFAGEEQVRGVVLDGLRECHAEQAARALAPLRDGDAENAELPTTSRLLTLMQAETLTPELILRRWRYGGRTTSCVVGESLEGAFRIDLAKDGPHALVAGTTGAGKSELLQTIIASLATTNRPTAMTFVLIDYKGGAAFKDATHLPHTVGMVTDLDNRLTERALASLSAELKRREHLLAATGTKDITDYWDHLDRTTAGAEPPDPLSPPTPANPAPAPAPPDAVTPPTPTDTAPPPAPPDAVTPPTPADPMPRTVLIIDEFASLVEELPDFVDGLVGIAMRGRSLGVHLILATQRPGGVVSPVIRANTNLRIALRVTDDSESTDVIDSTDAARIPKHLPGRAFLRVGSEPTVAFQTARVGGRTSGGQCGPTVTVDPWPPVANSETDPSAAADDATTDLQALARVVRRAAESEGTSQPRRPWLPPLPTYVSVDDLPRPSKASAGSVPYALLDIPAEQRRDVLTIDLDRHGSLLVAGSPRSGRTSALRTIAGQLARLHPTSDLHIYVVDCAGGGLSALADLPHCGAVCDRADVARGDRLIGRLLDEVGRRQMLLSRGGYSSVSEQRRLAPAPNRLPFIAVLLDSWEGFTQAFDDVDLGRPIEAFQRLLREGPAAGLRFVLTGDRSSLTGRLGSLVSIKIVLRLADRDDYALAGLPRRSIPDSMPDGRGVVLEDLLDVQLAVLSADPSGPAQTDALRTIAAACSERDADVPPDARPMTVRPLPERVTADALPPAEAGRPLYAGIGVGGDDARPIGVDLGAYGPGFLIAGPARSGRSTALRTMAMTLLAAGTEIAVVVSRRSPLRDLAGVRGVLGVYGATATDDLRAAVELGPVAVIVDDMETLGDAAVADVLIEILGADDGERAVIAAGRSDDLTATFRGLPTAIRASHAGLLLQPSSSDGELFGIRLPRVPATRNPGCGLLVLDRVATPVQVAAVPFDDDRTTGLAVPDPDRPATPGNTHDLKARAALSSTGRSGKGEIGRAAVGLVHS